MAYVKCPWCESVIPNPTFPNCPNCGGNLPLGSGDDPGPRPPSAPREIPKKFIKKIKYTNNVLTILGIVFTIAFCWTIIFPIIGIILWKKGLKNANEELNPLMNGNIAKGIVTSKKIDSSVKINGRSPTIVYFTFDCNGQRMEGNVGNLFDGDADYKSIGDAVWVVYMPDDPNQSSIWPPLT